MYIWIIKLINYVKSCSILAVFCPGCLELWLDSNLLFTQYILNTVSIAYICIIWEVVNSSERWLTHVEWSQPVWTEHCTCDNSFIDYHNLNKNNKTFFKKSLSRYQNWQKQDWDSIHVYYIPASFELPEFHLLNKIMCNKIHVTYDHVTMI